MRITRARVWPAIPAAAAVGLVLSGMVLAGPGPAAQAEGTITAVGSGVVTIAAAAGNQVRVTVTGETLIIQRKSVTLEDIKPNDFVGVTARREADGSLTAISINIFPPEFRSRVREAQFVMDTGNVMTNATVFQNVRRVGYNRMRRPQAASGEERWTGRSPKTRSLTFCARSSTRRSR